ncbi:hypothetical protein [Polynucleobacter sp. AP-Nino-20-G2]|uniref:hypothetical protein n=1 Tax=Polynucleobacter sp. AP-Nino-20-G2 TaxID=2576917 RepID=UPI001BFE59B1|nr:hypothetical protein [Polynucleobacter sp. AP-Nino-20-G2]
MLNKKIAQADKIHAILVSQGDKTPFDPYIGAGDIGFNPINPFSFSNKSPTVGEWL